MDRLWTVHDVAKYLGVPVKTLYEWRTRDYGPKGRRVGRHALQARGRDRVVRVAGRPRGLKGDSPCPGRRCRSGPMA